MTSGANASSIGKAKDTGFEDKKDSGSEDDEYPGSEERHDAGPEEDEHPGEGEEAYGMDEDVPPEFMDALSQDSNSTTTALLDASYLTGLVDSAYTVALRQD